MKPLAHHLVCLTGLAVSGLGCDPRSDNPVGGSTGSAPEASVTATSRGQETVATNTSDSTDDSNSGVWSSTDSTSGSESDSDSNSATSGDVTTSGASDESGGEPEISESGQLAFSRNGSIVMVDPRTGTETLMTGDTVAYDFVWDPDGSGIYFHEQVPGGGHVLHRSDLTGTTSALFASELHPRGLSVSADGEQLAWLALDLTLAQVVAFVILDADGSNPAQIGTTDGPRRYDISPDFGQIAWVGIDRLFQQSFPKGDPVELAQGPCGYIGLCSLYRPRYSPSASHLAFGQSQGPSDPNFAINDLYVVGTDGSGLLNVTSDITARPWIPRWSNSGERIAFTATQGDQTDIYVVNVDGTGAENLSDSATDEREPAWSPTDLRLAWLRGSLPQHDVVVYDIETGETELIATGAYAGVPPAGYSRGTPVVAWRP